MSSIFAILSDNIEITPFTPVVVPIDVTDGMIFVYYPKFKISILVIGPSSFLEFVE